MLMTFLPRNAYLKLPMWHASYSDGACSLTFLKVVVSGLVRANQLSSHVLVGSKVLRRGESFWFARRKGGLCVFRLNMVKP